MIVFFVCAEYPRTVNSTNSVQVVATSGWQPSKTTSHVVLAVWLCFPFGQT
jgi:hypothetical protein